MTDNIRAEGGSVVAGQNYIVGERGPEKFFPAKDGYIIPNGELVKALRENKHLIDEAMADIKAHIRMTDNIHDDDVDSDVETGVPALEDDDGGEDESIEEGVSADA